MTLKKDTGKKGEVRPEAPTQVAAPKETVPREGFNVIAEKNIFNRERKEFSVFAGTARTVGKSVTRPQITLYGVAIPEDYQVASIINPGRTLHKGGEIKTLKIGDMVGEYKLTRIMQDRIVMEAGEDSFEVLLYDPSTPKKRVEVKLPTQQTTVSFPAPAVIPLGRASPTPYGVVTPLPLALAPPATTAPSASSDQGSGRGRRPIPTQATSPD